MAQTILLHSDDERVRAELLRCSHQGDWGGMIDALESLGGISFPPTTAAIHDRARLLEEALTIARATRADLAGSLTRLSAASRFANCQDHVESTKS